MPGASALSVMSVDDIAGVTQTSLVIMSFLSNVYM